MMEFKMTPLPTVEDYRVATELIDEDMKRRGGAWVAVWRQEVNQDAMNDQKIAYATIAQYIEPTDGVDKPIDPMRQLSHTFKQGMYLGQQIVDLAHDGLIPLHGAPTLLKAAIDRSHEDNSDMESDVLSHGHAEQLINYGEEGLGMVGEAAQRTIDGWAEEVAADARVGRMLKLGCGAVLHASYDIHRGYFDGIAEKYAEALESNDIDLLAELEQDSGLGTGEVH